MTRLLRPFALLTLLVTCLAADAPATQPAQSRQRFFWKVTSPTTELYLLGSIHVGAPDFYPLPREIDAAFEDAKSLVVELDPLANQAEVFRKVMDKAMLPPGDSLDKHLSPKTFEALSAFAQKNGLPPASLKSMKPGMAITTAVTAALHQMGYIPELGIDMYFASRAHALDKPIIELETIDFQFSLLFDMDDAAAEASLTQDLESNAPATLSALIAAWQSGDVAAVEKLLLAAATTPESQRAMDKILYDRNVAMTAKCVELLKGHDKVFFTVGVAHMLGDKGILKGLESAGYRIERPEITPKAPKRAK